MSKLFSILLLSLCGVARAQNDVPMMPDGSRDMYVGVALATGTRVAAAGETRPVFLRPLLQVEWSNGIFVSADGVVGLHLSQTPGVEYGPLLAASNSRAPSDDRRLRGSHPISGSWDAGGFFNYYLGDNARLRSSIVYDTSAHGFRGEAGIQKTWNAVAPHHSVSLFAGVNLASDAVMRERYEVSRYAGGPRDYRPNGGLSSMNGGVNWNWALSNQWLLTSAVTMTRLGNAPAASPIVERRSFTILSTGLAYRF